MYMDFSLRECGTVKHFVHVWVLSHFSYVQLFVTLWIVACQAPQSMGFTRQEYWSGLTCPPPGNFWYNVLKTTLQTIHFSHIIIFSPSFYKAKLSFEWLDQLFGHYIDIGVFFVAQTIKNMPVMQKIWVRSVGQEDHLEKGMTVHSSILAWRIPRTEEPGRLQSVGLQTVGHDWVTNTATMLYRHRLRIRSQE